MALDVVPHQDLDNKALETPPTLQDKTEVDKKAALLGFSHEQPTQNMEEVDYESLPTDKLLPHLLAGGAAGVMEHCTMYPVDCVKVRRTNVLATCVYYVCYTCCTRYETRSDPATLQFCNGSIHVSRLFDTASLPRLGLARMARKIVLYLELHYY